MLLIAALAVLCLAVFFGGLRYANRKNDTQF